jgi:DNA-binding transcriptional MerR regulator
MSAQPARGYLGISEVLARLRADFPEVSVSKIRFLETEGLLTPARSPSGYRRFSIADVDRLRYILEAQRDHYLPLRVIKERLARLEAPGTAGPVRGRAGGSGLQPAPPGPVTASPVTASTTQLLSRRELVEAAGLTDALLTELEAFGLLRRVGRQYGPEALVVARTAVALTAYGVEARHLRAVRAAAERETTMIESLVAPIQRQRGAGARELAARTAGELADLVIRLHSALVEGALAEAGLAEAGLAEAGLSGSKGLPEAERDGQPVRGAEGASA